MTFQIKFHQIRAFVEVARQGSIRGASRTLNLSQPALTKSIKELEEGMAAQLFVRRSKGVALTECGCQRFTQPDARRYYALSCTTPPGQGADYGRAAGVDDQ